MKTGFTMTGITSVIIPALIKIEQTYLSQRIPDRPQIFNKFYLRSNLATGYIVFTHMSLITGIQQAGIGTDNALDAAQYYKSLLGFKALVFDDLAEASLMQRYTGGNVHQRRAILTMNMQGGGGLELWQFTDKPTAAADFDIRYGDLGLYALKIKCPDIARAHRFFAGRNDCSISPKLSNDDGASFFWLTDKYQQVFQLVQARELFSSNGHVCAGICGAVIGVSNLEKAAAFYQDLIGLKQVGEFASTLDAQYPGETFDMLQLEKSASGEGAFSRLLGSIQIDLVKANHHIGRKIYRNRYWGDKGFIHLCFDVNDMGQLKEKASKLQYPFTVDSYGYFEMEDAGGRFSYTEDPDGTLIELVETHRVPIIKKLGWFLDLKKRKDNKPLPDWMVKMMGLSKV